MPMTIRTIVLGEKLPQDLGPAVAPLEPRWQPAIPLYLTVSTRLTAWSQPQSDAAPLEQWGLRHRGPCREPIQAQAHWPFGFQAPPFPTLCLLLSGQHLKCCCIWFQTLMEEAQSLLMILSPTHWLDHRLWPGFQSEPCHVLAVGPWENCLPSLSLVPSHVS